MQASSIDEVISILDLIITESQNLNSSNGYFAALYRKVTLKVKHGIENGFFDNGPGMEKLDVLFANRYLAAYFACQNNDPVTESWQRAFNYADKYRPIVLQHLLMGMNAHINLDLGIAAAEVSKNKNIDDLHNDFNRINEILGSLVIEVQKDLAEIWSTLKIILKISGNIDDFLVDFSMKLAREGAWKFAKNISDKSDHELTALIKQRDKKVADKARIITNPGFITQILLGIIRLGERGSIAEKIEILK